MAHSNLRNHRKLRKLSSRLSISRPVAVGHLQHLWWAVDEYQASDPTGVLHGWTSEDIAADCEWPLDDADRLVSALVTVGFIDAVGEEYAIHDYADWCPQYVHKRWKRRGWKQDEETGKWASGTNNGHVDSHGLAMDSHGPTTSSKSRAVDTKPNQTKGNQTKPREEKDSPSQEAGGKRASNSQLMAPLWRMTAELWFSSKVPSDQESRVGRIVKLLAERDAEPEEVRRRLGEYKTKYPLMGATPEALLKHWGEFEKSKDPCEGMPYE